MNIIKFFSKIFHKKPYKNINPKGEYINPEVNKENGILCPHCHNDQWLSGPSGGGCTNIKCEYCGWWYNYMGPFGLTFLREND